MYHKYECFIGRILLVDDYLLKPMKTFFYALYLFDHKIEDLKALILSRGRERKTIFDFDMRDLNPIETGRNLLLCYDSLEPSKYCDEEKQFYLMFEYHPVLKKMWKKEWKFIEDFLYRHFDISLTFKYDLFQWPANTAELVRKSKMNNNIGNGCYVFTSLINHSCIPNVDLHCDINNKMHLIACQNIAKGEQLFVSYK